MATDDEHTPSKSFDVIGIGCLGLALMFVVIGAWGLYIVVLDSISGHINWPEEWYRIAIEVGFFLAAVLFSGWMLRSKIGSWRLGEVSLEIEPRLVQAEQSFAVTLIVTPSADIQVEGVTYRFDGVSHKNIRTFIDSEEELELFPAQKFAANQPCHLQSEVFIPKYVTSNLKAGSRAELQFFLTVQIKGWPSWIAIARGVSAPP